MNEKIAIINTVYAEGSTGFLAKDIYEFAKENGKDVYAFYGRGNRCDSKDIIRIDTKLEIIVHKILALITGYQGVFSNFATNRLLNHMNEKGIKTVIILNLHGYYLNELRLLKYLGENDIYVIYITPDEYAGMGKCTYHKQCNKYKNKCEKCPYIRDYPQSLFFDRSRFFWEKKKMLYAIIKNLVFVGPKNNVEVLRDSAITKTKRTIEADWGIDTSLYYPQYDDQIYDKYHIPKDKIIVLAVAQYSNPRKGIKKFFFPVAEILKDSKYHFINVGFDVNKVTVDVPSNMTCIPYISDQSELAKIYTLSDVYFIGSECDSQPLSCLIALACGTPIICFDRSGLKSIAPNDNVIGHLIGEPEISAVVDMLRQVDKKNATISETCRNYAEKRYSKKIFTKKILDLTESIE